MPKLKNSPMAKKPLPTFVQYITTEILPKIGDYELRAMMGGYILRSDSVTFAIFYENSFYLKAIPETEEWYLKHGCKKFGYINPKGKETFMPYFQLPEEIFDDLDTLSKLIKESIIVATITKKVKK